MLAGYALHSCNKYHLPIPNAMSALTIALPPLAGVAIETCIALRDKLEARGQLQSSRILPVIMGIFLVYEAVLATLAGTHISPPGSLDCALRETWQHMFRTKDEASVRLIQSAFACCGFGSLRDMAWPFPDAQHGSDACVVRYERDVPCIGPWRGEERKVAILLLVVPLAVFVWMVRCLRSPPTRSHTDRVTDGHCVVDVAGVFLAAFSHSTARQFPPRQLGPAHAAGHFIPRRRRSRRRRGGRQHPSRGVQPQQRFTAGDTRRRQ